ncbi:MAG: glycerol-3-phosphate dehydrogenase/oxidase, partial [Calditrichota bacterium]
KRQNLLRQLDDTDLWDMIIIGGGASGLGTAVDAASRGYKVVLFEQHDFAKGTSSRSTKLIHGGVRYLQQGNVSLVLEALHERGLLFHNAPHLVQNRSFIVPSYEWWNGPFYGVGLKVYDLLAGKLGLGPSRLLSREEVLEEIPTLEPEALRGGVVYHDGQFDDARLAINLMQTAVQHDAVMLNYMQVDGFLRAGDVLNGVAVIDNLSGEKHKVFGRVIINATGVFTDSILKMDNPAAESIITPSQGVHIVLDDSFLPGDAAVLVPHTDDGRVLFAVPWYDKVVVGTTDTLIEKPLLEPLALEEEIDFILQHAARYLTHDPKREDVLSVFAGLRPLVSPGGTENTSEISRDHYLAVSESGLVTIAGGKWTTYRKMAEDTINKAVLVAGLVPVACPTENLRIHGWMKNVDFDDPLHVYGSDGIPIRRMIDKNASLGERIHPDLPYCRAEILWAIREEMAQTVEDILSRRTRALLLNAKASIEMAPVVASLLAHELEKDQNWIDRQIAEYRNLASTYVV